MKTAVLHALGTLALCGLFVSACSSPAPQQSAPPSPAADQAAPMTAKPEVSINAVMVEFVDHAAHNLWNVEQEGKAPKTDADWEIVVEHAVQIAAAGPAITVGGTGPSDAVWIKSPAWHNYAQRMSDAGVAAMKAAQSKNVDALIKANDALVESCESCHKEFKPDLPTEGIAHKHVD
ncbi:MAG TPA: cytochrome c [Vicinamibacterales bacterium]|nr:cytochrome c [Vicinamibacterales bacterium]